MSDEIDKWNGLLDAAEEGDAKGVVRLLATGADANARNVLSGYTALHSAACRGHLEVVRLLVEAGADIADRRNTVRESALAGAVVNGRAEVVAYLLGHGGDPHETLYGDGMSLLEFAEADGFCKIAEMLQRALNAGNGQI